MAFTFREIKGSPLTSSEMDANFKEVEDIYAEGGTNHTQNTDVGMGVLGTKVTPVDADKVIQRNSDSADALVTSTWTQIKAFLKTYFDTLYNNYVLEAHASDHTDGTDDIQSATNAQKGLTTASHIQAIEANTSASHAQNTDTSLDLGGINPVTAAQIVTLKDTTVPAKADKLILETVEKTADYTLVFADKDQIVLMNKTGTATLTVPKNDTVDFPIGSVIGIYNASADAVTIAGATDVTVRNAGDLAQYSEVSLRKRAANEWVLAGSVS